MNGISKQQLDVCLRFGAEPLASPSDMKVGISQNVQDGVVPINGLRHNPFGDTTGWYIWAGQELSEDSDFFVPLHVSHLLNWCPKVIDYLALPPGSRFLLAPDYEDIWFDAAIVHD